MDRLIKTLELSTRARNGLLNSGVKTVGQLIQLSEIDLCRGRIFGRKSINEIKEVLCDLGLKLHDPSPSLGEFPMNETGKVEKIMICAARKGYIVTDGANPRVLESPHLIRVFETKDSLLGWLKENLMDDVSPPREPDRQPEKR